MKRLEKKVHQKGYRMFFYDHSGQFQSYHRRGHYIRIYYFGGVTKEFSTIRDAYASMS